MDWLVGGQVATGTSLDGLAEWNGSSSVLLDQPERHRLSHKVLRDEYHRVLPKGIYIHIVSQ